MEPGAQAQLRRLARLNTSDVEWDKLCTEPSGPYHGCVSAQVGRRVLKFDAHGAPSLERLLDALVENVEWERRRWRRRHR